jgi:hypothetical protein
MEEDFSMGFSAKCKHGLTPMTCQQCFKDAVANQLAFNATQCSVKRSF